MTEEPSNPSYGRHELNPHSVVYSQLEVAQMEAAHGSDQLRRQGGDQHELLASVSQPYELQQITEPRYELYATHVR
jgi:hypothetical protein